MSGRVLITGGAGFIGSHVAELLHSRGYLVRILDNICPQVHGTARSPDCIPSGADLVVGDICSPSTVGRALDDIDAVIHLAAAVGVGQSMYHIRSYTRTNDLGTAVLLEALAQRPVQRLICASSMSVYGEGLAKTPDGYLVEPEVRPIEQLRGGDWELRDNAGEVLTPLPTPEQKHPSLNSVYALNKFNQERLCLMIGKAYGIPTIALRFFNVYGQRQALSNPYTGVLAIFAARLLNGKPPLVFEDGNQQRDFVHVRDVARACLLALETRLGIGEVFNIASGKSRTVRSVAEDLAHAIGRDEIEPFVTGKFRVGDIRHCFADIERSRNKLGFESQIDFGDGLLEFADWLTGEIAEDKSEHAAIELAARGLFA